MGNNKMITLIDDFGKMNNIELVCAFYSKKLDNKYLIYSKNEKDDGGHTIIYLGKILYDNDKQIIVDVNEYEEWSHLKEIMKTMSKYSLEGEENV